ncbi:hypothetical protein SBA3_1110004 [Candidatus Sulfopaludibacter sp. SbA3]|nr:hypothetical protein SBA3_1110004 [Candidatus Sulfopaludibacter sp. SbA3]
MRYSIRGSILPSIAEGTPSEQRAHPFPDTRRIDKQVIWQLELLDALESSVAKAREALCGATGEHLMKNWRLLAHLAPHRGQLTVYLRLTDFCGTPEMCPEDVLETEPQRDPRAFNAYPHGLAGQVRIMTPEGEAA